MIRIIKIRGYELETDSQEIVKKTLKKLKRKGLVQNEDFFISEIKPHVKKKGGEMGK